MRKNKWLMLGIAVILLLAGGTAVFALEAALTVDIDANVLRIDRTGSGDTLVGSFSSSTAGTENYDDSNINFVFTGDDGLWGGQVQFGILSSTTPSLDTVFQGFSGWVMLSDYFKLTLGKPGRIRPTNRITDVIDDQNLGPMNGAQDVSTGFHTDELMHHTKRTLGAMGDFYFGKFFDQDFKVSAAVYDTRSVWFDADTASDVDNDGAVVTGIGVNFGGTIAEIVKLNATYRWTRNDLAGTTPANAVAAISSNGQAYRNNFGLYAGLALVENLDLTVGYGLSLLYLPFNDKTNFQFQKAGYTGSVKGFDKSMDAYHGIDLRAQFALSDTFKIATHNNISFGETVVRASKDYTAAQIAAGSKNIDIEDGHSYFGLYDSLGARIGLSDTLAVNVTVSNWLDIVTDVDVQDGKKNPWNDAGTLKDGVDTVNTYDKLVLATNLIYTISSNAEFRCGIEFGAQFHSTTDSEADAPYSTSRGTSISYEKRPTNAKGDKAVTYTHDTTVYFKVPVGVTLKF